MKSKRRVLKSHEVGDHDVVSLHDHPTGAGSATNRSSQGGRAAVVDRSDGVEIVVEEALLFTTSEVEDLCEKARASGAADAAAVLEPSLHKIAEALEVFTMCDTDAAAAAHRTDAETIVSTAIDVARWILRRELSDPKAVLDLVELATEASTTGALSTIRVHPDLATVLSEISPETVEVLADRTLDVGEFRSKSDGPDISLRFDVALNRAHDMLTTGEET